MKINRFGMALMATIGISSLSGIAKAQVFSAKQHGSGSVVVGGAPAEPLNYANVILKNDHTFVVQTYLIKDNFERGWSGKWRVSGPHTFYLMVNDYMGHKATGTGTLWAMPDNSAFAKVNLSGTGSDGAYSVTFSAAIAQKLSNHFGLTQVEHGTGALSNGGQNYDVRTAWVEIVPEGNFALRLMGDKLLEVRGHWHLAKERDNRIMLTLLKDKGQNPVTGDGSIVLKRDRRGYQTIDVTGSMNGQSFTGNFKVIADGATPPPPVGGKVVLHSLGHKDPNAVSDTTQLATGNFHFGNETAALTEARIALLPNGTFNLEGYGETKRLLKGTWKSVSPNEISLNIKGGYKDATGTGNVVYSSAARTKFTLINVSGLIHGLDFSMYLKAN